MLEPSKSDVFENANEISASSEENFFENFESHLISEDKSKKEQLSGVLEEQENKIKLDSRATLPFLTKYEKARILGARALQISMGSPLMVEIEGETDALDIAAKELTKRKIPISIRRYLPNGKYEDWLLDELIIE